MTDVVVTPPPAVGGKNSEVLIKPALSRAVLWMLVLAGAFWLLEHIKTTLTIFGLAFVIAYLLNSIVVVLETRYKMGRGKAIALVYVLLVVILGTAAALLVPLIINQVNGMVTQLPGLSSKITILANNFRENYLSRVPEQYQEQLKESVSGSASSAAEAAKFLFEHLRSFVMGLVSAAFLIFTGLIVSIYVILNWYNLGESALALLPRRYRQEIRDLGADLNRIFGGYLKAQITLASACGVATLALLFLHSLVAGSNPYMLVIACVAALVFPIPVINQVIPPLLGAILAYVNSDNASYAAQVALVVYLTNAIIERTIAPRIMSEAVGVSPLFVLFAAFSGAELLGPIGALLGVPLAAMAKSVFVWFHGRFLASQDAEEEAPVQIESDGVAVKVGAPVPEVKVDEKA